MSLKNARCIFLFLIPILLESSVFARDQLLRKKLTVDFRNAPLSEILKDIGERVGATFVCDPSLVESVDPVTYEAVDQEAGRILTCILRRRGLRLGTFEGNRVNIVRHDPYQDYRPQPEEVFDFEQPPTVGQQGDRITISFEPKGWCDVTVAIEDQRGRIIRHLASGVLGENAPRPFAWNSKKQILIWDGKNDHGQYVDDKQSCVVRVSLGLRARFERTLFWSPYKRIGFHYPSLAATPDGVVVTECSGVGHIRLFDHEGNYLKTIYPFPAGKIGAVKDLKTHVSIIDGVRRPLKTDYLQASILAAGTGEYNSEEVSTIATDFTGRLAVLQTSLNRLAVDGTSGGLSFYGPRVGIDIPRDAGGFGHNEETAVPLSAAFSPDGKFLYLTGYQFASWRNRSWLNAVFRLHYESDLPPELFLGNSQPGEHLGGTKPGEFRCATSVDTDAEGRIYVSDYMNERIQIFDANGKFLKAIPVPFPARVCVHKRTGEIFVFSYLLVNRLIRDGEQKFPARLFHFSKFENPSLVAEYQLPLERYVDRASWHYRGGIEQRVILDSWAEKPRFWLVNGYAGGIERHDDGSFAGISEDWNTANIQIWEPEGGVLKIVRRFNDEAKKAVTRIKPPILWRQRLYVNPVTGLLYVAEGDSGVMKSVNQLVEINPETGSIRLVDLPLGGEDFCFDSHGLLYIRTDTVVARYDPVSWREVPWDYGEERPGHSYGMGARAANLASALITPGHRSFNFWHLGGIDVNLKRHLVVTTCNGHGISRDPEQRRLLAGRFQYQGEQPYTPQVYPGRLRWGEIHIFDERGRVIFEDAVPGIGHLNGIAIDTEDNLYLLAASKRLVGGQPLDPSVTRDTTGTLLKVPAAKAKVYSVSGTVPVPLTQETKPRRPMDMTGYTTGWVEGAEWLYGGVGFCTPGACVCWNCRFDMDYFNRCFAPEPQLYSVAVLDAMGNVILRVGKYGNIEDGKPLVEEGGPPVVRSLGGDELGLVHPCYVATDTDRRLFIADAGNARIASVKLDYHNEKRVPLGTIPP